MTEVSMDSIRSMKPPAPDVMSAARPRTSRMPEPKPRAAASRSSCRRPRRGLREHLEMCNAPPFQIPCSVGLCPSQRLRPPRGKSPTRTKRQTLSVSSFPDWQMPASRLSKVSPRSFKVSAPSCPAYSAVSPPPSAAPSSPSLPSLSYSSSCSSSRFSAIRARLPSKA